MLFYRVTSSRCSIVSIVSSWSVRSPRWSWRTLTWCHRSAFPFSVASGYSGYLKWQSKSLSLSLSLSLLLKVNFFLILVLSRIIYSIMYVYIADLSNWFNLVDIGGRCRIWWLPFWTLYNRSRLCCYCSSFLSWSLPCWVCRYGYVIQYFS